MAKGGGQKKKKVTSNRGFSTVSVASVGKKKDIEEQEEIREAEKLEQEAIEAASKKELEESNNLNSNNQGLDHSRDPNEWDNEAMEKHSLQLLVEKVRTGIDKEVSRMGKIFEYEKRMAKGYSFYAWTDQDLQRRILALALSSADEVLPQPIYDLEDKVIIKVGIIFGILENLGFTKNRIEDSLRACKTLELEDALDWLFLHCESNELLCEGPIIAQYQPVISIPSTPLPELSISTSTPRAALNPLSVINPLSEASVELSLRARVLAYDDNDESSSNENDNDLDHENGTTGKKGAEEEEEDPLQHSEANRQYVKFKIQVSEIQRAQGAFKRAAKGKGKNGISLSAEAIAEEELREAQVALLQKKMKKITGDYTFRKVDAELLYRKRRVELDAYNLSARLNSTDLLDPSPISSIDSPDIDSNKISNETTAVSTATHSPTSLSQSISIENSSPTAANTPSASILLNNDKSSLEGTSELFGNLLEEMPTSETNDFGTTIQVLNMGLSKNFSGKSPRTHLEEIVKKMDKYATVVFTIISSSRAVRSSVTIRWEKGRCQSFEMQDIACWSSEQSNNYIATVALFEISPTSINKLLPPVYRDLWDTLVEKKKEEDDEIYRERIKLFKSIAEPRLQPSLNRDPRNNKLQQTAPLEDKLLQQSEQLFDQSEYIKHELAYRQSWPTYQAMLNQRNTLPIANYRTYIMDTIESSQCVVLCGETGCGKSTQVPSFILEHEMSKGKKVKIFCTEPRRISAISLAQRVSAELGEVEGAGTRNSFVGYSIRLDSQVSPNSKIIYATTGIVLRMLEGHESLSDCTHIIIDEVHERSIDSDFLMIVLREILEVRKDLKVILMSATVDATKISAYMGNCPVINVPGRTFPVTALFLEDTIELTGYRLDPNSDSPYVARHMRQFNGRPRTNIQANEEDDEVDDFNNNDVAPELKFSARTLGTLQCIDPHAINFDLIVLLLENLCFNNPDLIPFSAATLIFLPSLESIRRLTDILEGHPLFGTNYFLILPLHSTISNDNQGLVFNVPRQGIRKIVISTNIAETGVTIPDITSVIDTGKHREMRFDEKRQISRLVETFVAQSNASQRRGRAGRVQEGICFHLFTKHRHDTIMAEHSEPEMLRLSLQDLALRIKIMNIGNSIEDVLLKALDPPLLVNIQRAIASLIEAKALNTAGDEITPLGIHLAKLPMDVHLGKFLILCCLFNCVDAGLTITATLNSKSPWKTPFGREAEADSVKRSFKVDNSDFLTTYNAFCSWKEASFNGYEREFTRKSFLSQQNLLMIEELKQQYYNFLVDANFIPSLKSQSSPPRNGKSRIRFLHVPASIDTHSKDSKCVMACIAAALYPKLLIIDSPSGQMRTLSNNAAASVHPSSVNFTPGRRNDFGDSKFVPFFQAMHTKKLYIWESGSVDERAIYLLCGNAEFQLPAHSLSIDRKIRVQLEPKTSIAMKVLRNRFTQLFSERMKNPSIITTEQKEWFDLVKEALVSKKPEDEVKLEEKVKKKVHLSIHRNA